MSCAGNAVTNAIKWISPCSQFPVCCGRQIKTKLKELICSTTLGNTGVTAETLTYSGSPTSSQEQFSQHSSERLSARLEILRKSAK